VLSGNANLFNSGTFDRSSFNIGAELGIVQNVATVQLAYRKGLSGIDGGTVGGTAGTNATDNAVLIGATYAIALNARLELTYSIYSGDLYTTTSTYANATGTSQTVVDLAFGF
jgi:alanine dehydrogenase